MDPIDDVLLLREYSQDHSEQAFETLVVRYLDLVYSAALRQARSAYGAEEITQATFIILAQKADRLRAGVFLPSWLLRTVQFAAASERRAAVRRQRYEKEAQMESLMHQEGEREPAWEELAPLLDEAVASLSAEGLRFAYIGNVPGLADAGTTWCPGCKKAIIERDIFAVTRLDVAGGKCRFCGVKIAGVWS